MLNYQIQQFIRTFCPHMHWPMFSARGRQFAVFWETPMPMNVCCPEKPAERDVELVWLTGEPV